jgi:hypothetical protein
MISNLYSLCDTVSNALISTYQRNLQTKKSEFPDELPTIDSPKHKATLANLTRRLFDKLDLQNLEDGKTYSYSKADASISAQFTKEGKLSSLTADYLTPYDDNSPCEKALRISNAKTNAFGTLALTIAGLSLAQRAIGHISDAVAVPLMLAFTIGGAVKGYQKQSPCHWDVKWHDKIEGKKKERIKESHFSQTWGNWFTSTEVHSYNKQDQSRK